MSKDVTFIIFNNTGMWVPRSMTREEKRRLGTRKKEVNIQFLHFWTQEVKKKRGKSKPKKRK